MATFRIIFAGTPDFAVPALQALVHSEHEIIAVYTQPDRPAGRGLKLQQSPIKRLAILQGLNVEQPETLRDAASVNILTANGFSARRKTRKTAGVYTEVHDCRDRVLQQSRKFISEAYKLRDYAPDLIIVVAYGLILPENILKIPRYGCLNIHASLLPRWRGAAPIVRAILAGDDETGISIMQMNQGLDTGDILLQQRCPILAEDTSQILHDRLAQLGATTLIQTLASLTIYQTQATHQPTSQVSYAAKISKQEACLDWSLPAEILERHIRAFIPRPVAFTHLNNQSLRIWRSQLLTEDQALAVIEQFKTHTYSHALMESPPGTIIAVTPLGIDVMTGQGILRLLEIQFAGGKPLAVKEILKSRQDLLKVGQRFTSTLDTHYLN